MVTALGQVEPRRFGVGCTGATVGHVHSDLFELSTVTSTLALFCRNTGESASCTVIFVIVYYFTVAGVVWFAILAYTWHVTFRTYNSKRDVIEGRKGYFHLVAWSLPFALTVVCLAVTQVSISRLHYFGYCTPFGFVLHNVLLLYHIPELRLVLLVADLVSSSFSQCH